MPGQREGHRLLLWRDRMLWGGNYLVVGSDEDYAREAELIRSGGFVITSENVGKVTHDTAKRI